MRKSNFELLRIISMMAIVSHHFWYGDFVYPQDTISFNRILYQISRVGGGFGNICFILICGYFMVDSEFRIKKIFRLWLEMLFYSVGCLIVACFVSGEVLGLTTCIKAFFPFATGQYWFMTAYIILMFLSPYINIVIKNISKEQHQRLLLCLFAFASVIPALPMCPAAIISDVGFYIFIYLIAAYIRLYPSEHFENNRLNVFLGLASIIVILSSIVVLDLLGVKISVFSEKATYFTGMSSPLVLLCAVSCFLFFRNIAMPYNKFVNYVAKSTLAVFLIHNNQNIRDYMWSDVFQNTKYVDSPFLLLYEVMCVLIIMVVGTLIDVVRREGLEKPIFSYFKRKLAK